MERMAQGIGERAMRARQGGGGGARRGDISRKWRRSDRLAEKPGNKLDDADDADNDSEESEESKESEENEESADEDSSGEGGEMDDGEVVEQDENAAGEARVVVSKLKEHANCLVEIVKELWGTKGGASKYKVLHYLKRLIKHPEEGAVASKVCG